ncbi:TetR/AcrR family transcriptional regulator [Agrobacterium larrymoorei]|nr:TetR/AcrR family transcriptional regulator [Agrobacterium larrymoorei]
MQQDKGTAGKRLEIVEQAFERFYDGGFHATGVDTVMAETGISKRTLYKYFPSKEALIAAVLEHYGEKIGEVLFKPVTERTSDPIKQISECFDARQDMLESYPIRGCLGLKAAQEYIGKNDEISDQGRIFAIFVENWFIDNCRRADVQLPEILGRQISMLFQGAVLLSQIYGNTSPFAPAKLAVERLVEAAMNTSLPA